MNTIQHEGVVELLPAYALGALDPEERPLVEAHLGACPECRALAASFVSTANQLATLAPQRTPPLRLKARVLRTATTVAQRPQRRPLVVAALGLAAVVAVALFASLLTVVLQLNARVEQTRTQLSRLRDSVEQQRIVNYLAASPGTQVVFLEDAQGGRGGGMLMVPQQERRSVLVVYGLQPLPSDRAYQVWLLRDGQRYSGGLFTVDPDGYGLLRLTSPIPVGEVQQIGVTIEPAGGSPGPTGTKVLGADRS